MSGDALRPAEVKHVFYVPGYDPRSPRHYFLLFRRELKKYAGTTGCPASLARIWEADPPERSFSRWRFRVTAGPEPTETTMDFLDWHDIAAQDFAMGAGRRFLESLAVLRDAIRTGTVSSMYRENWKFFCFSMYPWALFVLYVVCALAIVALSGPLGRAAGTGAAAGYGLGFLAVYGFYRLTGLVDRKLYVWYLLNDWIFTRRFRLGRAREAMGRFGDFARHIVETGRESGAAELLVVGHSSGSFIAIDIVARALALDPSIRLTLLTMGSNTPIAAGGHADSPTRRDIATLVTCDRVRWIEYFAPQDILNFPNLDPVRAFRIDLAGRPRHNPSVRSARFRETMSEENYERTKFRFYAFHFQYLMANDIPGEYDFYRFLTGPVPLRDMIPR